MLVRVRFASLLLVLNASSAHAWEVFVRVSLEVTCRGTSETSSAASSASDREARRQERMDQYSQGGECRIDSDCQLSQYCEQGRCVQPVATAPGPQTHPLPGCSNDSQCAIGYACLEARCVERTAAPQLPPVDVPRCETYLQCGPGQSCVSGQCMSPPPAPPSSSLLRRGTEVYLRERAAQLRQDLALGEGPVIANLALQNKVTSRKLGLIVRANRAELRRLVGDASDTVWPSRFLERVDQLLAPKSAAAPVAKTETAG